MNWWRCPTRTLKPHLIYLTWNLGSFHMHTTFPEHNMESDRAATNLGPDVSKGMAEEHVAIPKQKQPKKRFLGKRLVSKASEERMRANANIEDSSAIQGMRRHLRMPLIVTRTNGYSSGPASPHCSRLECHPSIYTA